METFSFLTLYTHTHIISACTELCSSKRNKVVVKIEHTQQDKEAEDIEECSKVSHKLCALQFQ